MHTPHAENAKNIDQCFLQKQAGEAYFIFGGLAQWILEHVAKSKSVFW